MILDKSVVVFTGLVLKTGVPLCLRLRQGRVKMCLIPRWDRDLPKVVSEAVVSPRMTTCASSALVLHAFLWWLVPARFCFHYGTENLRLWLPTRGQTCPIWRKGSRCREPNPTRWVVEACNDCKFASVLSRGAYSCVQAWAPTWDEYAF